MNASRLKSFGKLMVLIGLPVAFVVGLFGAGVYVGYGHRAAILGFERDWLGRDVEVPDAPAKPAETPAEVTPEVTPPKPVETPIEKPTEVTPVELVPEVKPAPEVAPKPEVTPPVAVERAQAAIPVPVAEPEPVPAELQAMFNEPRKIRVKVVIDDALFDRRSDWLDHVERQVRWASQVLMQQLGVELELRGVVASSGTWSSGQVALAELRGVGSDGADLVLGLGGRNIRAPSQAGPATASAHANTAIAFADPSSPAPHLRAIVRAVTHAMGGDPIAADSVAIAFTAEGRRMILERKHLPFAPEPTAPAEPTDDAELEGDN